MRKLPLRILVCVTAILFSTLCAQAQYYDWGADAESLSWSQIKGDGVRVIYPDSATGQGMRMYRYVTAIKPYIGYGLKDGAMKNTPLVIHPENFASNGLSILAPKRIEILSVPGVTYATPWLKQLAVHEYRHSAQYANVNHGLVKALGVFLGQQSPLVATFCFTPLWVMEGDATLFETQATSFGRGLQPSFSLGYRAIGRRILQRKNMDKWYCGSYKDYVPDHYELGYQLLSWADRNREEYPLGEITRFARRNYFWLPFAAHAIAWKRRGGISCWELPRRTFSELNDHWDSLEKTSDSATPIRTAFNRHYAVYQYPELSSDGHILCFKRTLDRTCSAIMIDPASGHEHKLFDCGTLSARPSYSPSRIFWTEYRHSTLYQQRENSVICFAEIGSARISTLKSERKARFVEAISDDEIAWIRVSVSGEQSVVRARISERDIHIQSILKLPLGTEVNGLAWDKRTQSLYCIALNDSGMFLARCSDSGLVPLTEPNRVTISDLSARDGILYFGSILSGKDEIHSFELSSSTESKLTSSRFGSFQGRMSADGRLVLTSYSEKGYYPAIQHTESHQQKQTWSYLPKNTLNPVRKQWKVANIDSVSYRMADSTVLTKRSKRFSKVGHLFNLHSWAPFSFNPSDLSDADKIPVNIGSTIMSQNLLSTMQGYLSYGWNRLEGSILKGSLTYSGLGIKLGGSFYWGGDVEYFYPYTCEKDSTGITIIRPKLHSTRKHLSIGAQASLPLQFRKGNRSYNLTLGAVYRYTNSLIADFGRLEEGPVTNEQLEELGFTTGRHTMQFSAHHSSYTDLAHRDFNPRWGYELCADLVTNLSTRYINDVYSLYAATYLPGITGHHSVYLAVGFQDSFSGFDSKSYATQHTALSRLIPHGFYTRDITADNMFSLSANYALPLWYPDGGIPGVLYIKRIRVNLGFDYATFNRPVFSISKKGTSLGSIRRNIYSYGGSLTFDLNVFRMPASATTPVTISIYKPSKGSVDVTLGISMPF